MSSLILAAIAFAAAPAWPAQVGPLPAALTPEAVLIVDELFPDKLSPADWDQIGTALAARTQTPIVRFTRAYAAMTRGAVSSGASGRQTIIELRQQALAIGDRRLAAYLTLAEGRGLLGLSQNKEGLDRLSDAVSALRTLGDDIGLVRGLYSLSSALLARSRRPFDALGFINELLVVASRNKLTRYQAQARRLHNEWRRQTAELDDYFGRAKNRIQYFPPSLGIPVDADLVAQKDGVFLLNGDTDDQMPAAEPRLVTFDGIFARELMLPDDTLELRGSLVDQEGHLWAATNRGLYLYDGGGFRHWVNPALGDENENGLVAALKKSTVPRQTAALPSNIVNEIKQGPDASYYMATNRGVAIWNRKADTWRVITAPEAPLPLAVERVAPAPDGTLTVAWQHEYAVRSLDGTWQRFAFDFPTVGGRETGMLFGLLIDNSGRPWVHGLAGAKQLRGSEIITEVTREFNPVTRSVNHILSTRDQAIWFATPDGVCRKDNDNCAALGLARWMPAEWSLDLMEWPDNNVWVSVYQGGLNRILPPSYQHIGVPEGMLPSISSQIMVVGDDFYLNNPRGLTRLNRKSGHVDNFISGAEGIPKGQIAMALRLSDSSLALIGPDLEDMKEVVFFDGKRGREITVKQGLRDEHLVGFCEFAPLEVLTMTGGGAQLINVKSGAVSEGPPALTKIAAAGVTSLSCAPNKEVWITTRDDALMRVSEGVTETVDLVKLGLKGKLSALFDARPNGGLFVFGERNAIRYRGGAWSEVALDASFDFRVREVLVDENEWIYISTESGVFIFNGEDWAKLTTADGLSSDTSFGLQRIDGRLWVSGQSGLTVWSPPAQRPPETLLIAGQAANFVNADGALTRLLVSDGVSQPGKTIVRSLAGNFAIANEDAAAFWPPSTGPASKPILVPSSGEACAADSREMEATTYAARDRDFTLSASTAHFGDLPERFHYRYRLDGGPWQSIERQAFTLRELSDGPHLVEARSTDPRLVKDPTPARLCFNVNAPVPPWKIGGAFAFAGLFLYGGRRRLLGLFLLVKHRSYRDIPRPLYRVAQPALGEQLRGRDKIISELERYATQDLGQGTSILLDGEMGLGKTSVLSALLSRLETGKRPQISVRFDCASEAPHGSVRALLGQLETRIRERCEAKGITLPPVPDALGSSVGDGDGHQTRVGKVIRRDPYRQFETFWELSSKLLAGHRLLLAFDHLEQLEPVLADETYGSHLFGFFKRWLQAERLLCCIWIVDGRREGAAEKYDVLYEVSRPIALTPLEPAIGGEVLNQGGKPHVVYMPDALMTLSAACGGRPLLLQLAGESAAEICVADKNNLVTQERAQRALAGLVRDSGRALARWWSLLPVRERLVLSAVVDAAGKDGATSFIAEDRVVSVLSSQRAPLLAEEARRSLVALVRDGTLVGETGAFRFAAGALFGWISAEQNLAKVVDGVQNIVGSYQLVGLLGKGGMGEVYKARHLATEAIVALKLMHPSVTSDADASRRFAREAKIGMSLRSPYIVRVYESGEFEGRAFIAMEYLAGVTLLETVKQRQRYAWPEALALLRMIAEGLGAIHTAGVVHRDIKTENIFLVDRRGGSDAAAVAKLPSEYLRPVLMDFGLAIGGGYSRVTQSGAIVGTLSYMSPEQATTDSDLTPATDIYSLGVVLYQLLTGELPMRGDNAVRLLKAILNPDWKPVSSLVQGVPPQVDALVARMLAVQIPERFQTTDELRKAIDELLVAGTKP